MSRWVVVFILGLGLVSWAGPAAAHGDLHGTKPEPGSVLTKAPRSVYVDLTEAPGPGSTLVVSDGCSKDAGEEASLEGSKLVAAVPNGQPGDWVLKYRAISSVDGHVTGGRIHFTVEGKKDCSETDDTGVDIQIGGGVDTRVGSDDVADDGGFPIVPVAIGSVVLVGLALVLRRVSAR